jgi:hypothetical protein
MPAAAPQPAAMITTTVTMTITPAVEGQVRSRIAE